MKKSVTYYYDDEKVRHPLVTMKKSVTCAM